MMYMPHILQIKVVVPMSRDEFGRPITGTGSESWQDVCGCRCDDNSTKEFTSDNGAVYRPSYHVVCEKETSIKAGDIIRCVEGDNVRGEGEVYMVKRTNYLNYSDIWV